MCGFAHDLKGVFLSKHRKYETENLLLTMKNKDEMTNVTSPVQQLAELVLRRGGKGPEGQREEMAAGEQRGRLDSAVAQILSNLFCLFAPCLSGFRKKLLLSRPLRKTKHTHTHKHLQHSV